ncbi:MAG: hypothetical protein KAV87_43270 [Desulfobacteraceae bacterium]|nr:hypothetical protein [Desulfobacteraceae bacterium]
MVKLEQENIDQLYLEAKKTLVNYRYLLLENDPTHEVEPAPYHQDWSDMLLNEMENEAIQGYRESAKTQYVLRSFPQYCLTYPTKKRDYIVILKNNADLAHNKLKEIETEYNTNGLVSANKVGIREQSGKAFSVDAKDENGDILNIRIEAYGKGSSIRGLSYKERRPKVIICDDLQDRDEMKGEAVPESDWRWFMSDVYFLGKYSRIFLISNNLGEKCIIERIANAEDHLGFKFRRVSAIIKTVDGREASAWPARYTLKEIHEQREKFSKQGLLAIWLEEKMCQATSEETRIFNEKDYRHYTARSIDRIMQGCNRFATLDPAYSQRKSACYRAITVNAVSPENYWYIPEMLFGRWDSVTLIDKIFDTVVKYKLREFGIEKGEYKEVIEPFLYKEMSKRNVFFNIIPLEHAKQGSKLERIKMLQPRFKAHTIWFPDDDPLWLTELKSELKGVTNTEIKSLFIDLVDSLAMQEQIAKVPHGRTPRRDLPTQTVSAYDPLSQ